MRSPNELWRENQQPVITVTAELGETATWAASTASCKQSLPKLKFPPGYRWELAGNYRRSRNRSPAC